MDAGMDRAKLAGATVKPNFKKRSPHGADALYKRGSESRAGVKR